MVNIIEDTSGLLRDPSFTYLADYSGYIPFYKLIQESLDAGSNLTVVVRSSSVAAWFGKMKLRYPPELFQIIRVTYRTYLIEQWGIEIPVKYSDNDLSQCDLINLDRQPARFVSFEDFILSYFYGAVFANRIFTPSMIVPLLNSFDSSRWKTNSDYSLLNTIYTQRLADWRSRLRDDALSVILERFTNDFDDLLTSLMIFKVLRSKIYDKLGTIVLKKDFDIFSSFKLNLNDISVDISRFGNVIDQIKIHLNTISPPADAESLNTFLYSISGLVVPEFDYVEDVLKRNPALVSNSLIQIIKSVFLPIQSKIARRIDALYRLIIPEKPIRLEPDASLDFVKSWLVDRYLPFLKWLLHNNKHDRDFLAIGDSFSEWLYNNWLNIKSNSRSLVSNWLYNNSAAFSSRERINLVIIVDNLSFSFSDDLSRLFREAEFTPVAREPYFSMIPSETGTSKNCLLSGNSNYADIDQQGYSAILSKGWIPFFDSGNFIYYPDLDRLERSELELGKSYFVNYLAIDNALHTDESSLGLPHGEHIPILLSKLVSRIKVLLEERSISEKTSVHLISDHGSAYFHPDLNNELDMKYFKELTPLRISERFLFLSDKDYASLPDNFKHDCFFLDKKRFGLLNHCLCARRGNTFKKYSSDSFIHGGLLPEEIVVPHLLFEKVSLLVRPPILSLIRNRFRYRTEEIEIQFDNPNSVPLEEITVKVSNSNVETNGDYFSFIKQSSKLSSRFAANFKKAADPADSLNLSCRVSFSAAGRQYVHDYKLPVTMVSMVELKDNTVFDI